MLTAALETARNTQDTFSFRGSLRRARQPASQPLRSKQPLKLEQMEDSEAQVSEVVAAEVLEVVLTAEQRAFLVACAAGNRVQIEIFLKKKVDPNLKSPHHGLQPLHLVCGSSALDCAKLLVEAKADIVAPDPMGLTPLAWVRRGARCARRRPARRDQHQHHHLQHYHQHRHQPHPQAAGGREPELVRYLISAGAKPALDMPGLPLLY